MPDKRYTMAQESTEARLSLRKLPFKIAAIEAHEKFKFNYYSKNKNFVYFLRLNILIILLLKVKQNKTSHFKSLQIRETDQINIVTLQETNGISSQIWQNFF